MRPSKTAAGGAGGFGGFDFSGADMGDIFGDIFGDLFGGGRSSRSASNGPMRGANVRTSVQITFEEAIFGCEKELDLNLKEVCDKCHGTGANRGTQPQTCPKCNGKGKNYVYPAVLLRPGTECSDLSGLRRYRQDIKKCRTGLRNRFVTSEKENQG